MISGVPVLLDTTFVQNPGKTAAKNQGIASAGSNIFLAQGSQSENPTVTAYDLTGRLVAARAYSRDAFMEAINQLSPGTLTNAGYLYECEGATSLEGKLVTGQIVNDNPSVTADGVFLVMQHNSIDGVRINPSATSMKMITPWLDLTLAAGWSHVPGNGLQARIKDGVVEYRGFASNGTFAGGYTKVATLPEGIPGPERDAVFHISGNTTAVRSVTMKANGDVQFYTSAQTASWYGLSGVRYGA